MNIDGQLYIPQSSGGGGGGAAWGDITGTLSDQTDLQAALNAKVDETTTVNSQPLSSNVVLDTDDVSEGASNLYFTDERAQDAVGTALTDTDTIDFVYTDAAGTIEANVKYQDTNTTSLVNTDTNGLAIDVTYQDTDTIDLSDDASGLKADVKFSAAADNVASNSTGVYVKRQSTSTSAAPTVNDDSTQGILIGHFWNDTSSKLGYICISNSAGAAVWKQVTGVFREMDIPANAMTPKSTGGAEATTIDLANGFALETLAFDAATAEYANFTVRFPNVVEASQGLGFQLHWLPSAAGAGNVVWVIDYYLAADGASVSGTFVSSDSETVAADGQYIKDVATFSGTFMVPSTTDVAYFRVYRDAADGADTYAADALLERIVIQYKESNAINSAVF